MLYNFDDIITTIYESEFLFVYHLVIIIPVHNELMIWEHIRFDILFANKSRDVKYGLYAYGSDDKDTQKKGKRSFLPLLDSSLVTSVSYH